MEKVLKTGEMLKMLHCLGKIDSPIFKEGGGSISRRQFNIFNIFNIALCFKHFFLLQFLKFLKFLTFPQF